MHDSECDILLLCPVPKSKYQHEDDALVLTLQVGLSDIKIEYRMNYCASSVRRLLKVNDY